MTPTTARGSLGARMTPADSMATPVPAPRAMPTWGPGRRAAARVRAGAEGDAGVGPRQCRCIVDAVADHGDPLAPLLELVDGAVLVLGQDFGEDLIEPELGGDGFGAA